MASTSVLVLGSKPDAKIVTADVVYGANSAAGYYKSELREQNPGVPIVSVVSAGELDFAERTLNQEKRKWLLNKKKLLVSSDTSRVVIYAPEIYKNATASLIESGYQATICHLSNASVNLLWAKYLGREPPIICTGHLRASRVSYLSLVRRYVVEKARDLHYENYEVSGLFRPSTGILSLIVAIEECGSDAEYNISGISFAERGIYPDNTLNTWSKEVSKIDFHVIVDKYVVSALQKKYFINVL